MNEGKRHPGDEPFFQRCAAHFQQVQASIIEALEQLDGQATFARDAWTREELESSEAADSTVTGGGGLSCVMEGGAVFERAGVNFSMVRGRFSEDFAAAMPGEGLDFAATGVSLVLHPRNPHVPTTHLNYRRLARGNTGWFGGGADLTPYYLYDEDAAHFHHMHAGACLDHPEVADYARFKQTCDQYFHLPHRGERRGIGGIFFDWLQGDEERTFAFVRDAAAAFLPAYLPIARRRHAMAWGERERQWQTLRRGRYVEFNLVHDRGTTFGLRTGGRTESILMSMPPEVSWRYRHTPEPGSPEARLLEVLRAEPRDWLA